MFGDETGVVRAIRPFALHGLPYWDVVLEFEDGRVEQATLGDEAVPGGLRPGDRVRASKAGMMIIGLGREVE
jgi:hypothetical protein